jgi:uncharacterized protein
VSAFNRRQILGLAALLGATPALGTDPAASPALLLSAASDTEDRHWVVGLQFGATSLETAFRQQLPERAHHIAVNAQRGFYIVLARRPGTWLQLGELSSGTLHSEIRVPADRHLFGHGVFSADGALFYTTESDFENLTGDSGLVVEWEVQGSGSTAMLLRRREFSSYGVGPHELLLHPDGDTLVLANGGIRTHPAHDRDNLNIDSMQPSLAYIDRHSGALLEQHYMPPEFHQSGIRHLDVNAEGLVVMGMQFEGEPWQDVPLLASHRRGEELRLISAPPQLQPQMKQYVGSVRFDSAGRYFVASCPRGDLLSFWDARSGAFLHSTRARDGCAVAAVENGFVFSTGTGRIGRVDLASGSSANVTAEDIPAAEALTKLFWDNHMTLAGSSS